MKKILGLTASLTIIAGVCAAVLAYIDSLTRAPIAEIKVKKERAAAIAVMPEGTVDVRPAGVDGVFTGLDGSGKTLGYAVVGSDPGGYGGDIVLMVGFAADRKTVVTYKALQANETPGLGTKLSSPGFSGQFEGKDASKKLSVTKDGGDIEAITSATITSRAVCAAVGNAASKLSGLAE